LRGPGRDSNRALPEYTPNTLLLGST
jgi:hypothetical protein